MTMPHLRFCWVVDYVGRISQLCALKTFNRGRSTGLLRILLVRATITLAWTLTIGLTAAVAFSLRPLSREAQEFVRAEAS